MSCENKNIADWYLEKSFLLHNTIIGLTESFIGLLLHTAGIYILTTSKRKTNQVLILISLSISEFLCMLFGTAIGIISIVRYEAFVDTFRFYARLVEKVQLQGVAVDFFHTAFTVEFLSMMVILTGDRLVFALSPMKYKANIHKSIMLKIIAGSWFVSVIIGGLGAIPGIHTLTLFIRYMLIALGVICFLLVCITYSFILYKIKISQRQFNTAGNERTLQVKSLIVPGLIISSFVLLYGIPYIVNVHFAGCREKPELTAYMDFLIVFGFLVDPIVYIFLTKDYRDKLKKTLLPCLKEASRTNQANTATSNV